MKELRCSDVGFDCDAVVTGETVYDVLGQAAQHAQEVHGLSQEQVDDPDFESRATALVHDGP
ncbi:putative small metal-binding protein [Ornithinimicrobium humiphilum]|uniref:Putative small metal-binding protein n=1 Tax=Ornithinimicrobium humiphilum TaxID=125288 RepID=A0A543KMP2_9MICO|nr:DUF1059 domain-containing protein [Ornithinimicrobium humiphilum]TQM96350.1 putative small metal-binding protein [Ornithinimicrobium humiphilum]